MTLTLKRWQLVVRKTPINTALIFSTEVFLMIPIRLAAAWSVLSSTSSNWEARRQRKEERMEPPPHRLVVVTKHQLISDFRRRMLLERPSPTCLVEKTVRFQNQETTFSLTCCTRLSPADLSSPMRQWAIPKTTTDPLFSHQLNPPPSAAIWRWSKIWSSNHLPHSAPTSQSQLNSTSPLSWDSGTRLCTRHQFPPDHAAWSATKSWLTSTTEVLLRRRAYLHLSFSGAGSIFDVYEYTTDGTPYGEPKISSGYGLVKSKGEIIFRTNTNKDDVTVHILNVGPLNHQGEYEYVVLSTNCNYPVYVLARDTSVYKQVWQDWRLIVIRINLLQKYEPIVNEFLEKKGIVNGFSRLLNIVAPVDTTMCTFPPHLFQGR